MSQAGARSKRVRGAHLAGDPQGDALPLALRGTTSTGEAALRRKTAHGFLPGTATHHATHTRTVHETDVDVAYMVRLRDLYFKNAALQAARRMIHSHVLSGGLRLCRNGEDVPMTDEFTAHLNEHYLPFAHDCIDSIILYGLVVVGFDTPTRYGRVIAPPPIDDPYGVDGAQSRYGPGSAGAAERTQFGISVPKFQDTELDSLRRSNGDATDALNDHERVLVKEAVVKDGSREVDSAVPTGSTRDGKSTRSRKHIASRDVVPVVPKLGTYSLKFSHTGHTGYNFAYRVYNSLHGQEEDPDALVMVSSAPDERGRVNSQISSVFEIGTTIDMLTQLALQCETVRTQATMVTQRKETVNAAAVTGADMYFDSFGEQQVRKEREEMNMEATRQLQQMQQLTKLLNDVGTRIPNQVPGAGMSGGQGNHAQLMAQLDQRLYALPYGQELVNPQLPEARNDLDKLIRICTEFMCSAVGVPSSLIFETSHSSHDQSNNQVNLMNSTVSELRTQVDKTLTAAFDTIYGSVSANGRTELKTATRLVSVNAEITDAFEKGLMGWEEASPLIMESFGLSQPQIAVALKRRAQEQARQRQVEEDDKRRAEEDHKQSIKRGDAEIAKIRKEAANVGTSQDAGGSSASA